MKTRKLHYIQGYTMIELMVTLAIFSIVTLFAVPAFFTFIEQSRAKAQIAQAANFMRSAQEIAISSNRTVYVFTEGLLTYSSAPAEDRADYWTNDWIMAFKPMGMRYITMPQQVDEIIRNTANYKIAQQRIFTRSEKYVLSIIDSKYHNNVSLFTLSSNANGTNAYGNMEGYSKVTVPAHQGAVTGAPTFIAFYPSGEVSLPIFVISERTADKDNRLLNPNLPFAYDFTFSTLPSGTPTARANQWTTANQQNFVKPIAMLGGCRSARQYTVDAINYTFNPEVMASTYLFDGTGNSTQRAHNLPRSFFSNFIPAPSFGHYLCGSKFLR